MESEVRKSSRAGTLAAMKQATALVTGASGGIGAAICHALASRGTAVILHYRSERTSAEATRSRLPGEGHTLVQADLADAAQVARLWQELAARRPSLWGERSGCRQWPDS